MKKLLFLFIFPLIAFGQTQTQCDSGPCAGLGSPVGQCRAGTKYAQIDGQGNVPILWMCGGIPPTWTASGGSTSLVTSVFGRTGDVAAQAGDYNVTQVTGAAPTSNPVFTGNVQADVVIANDFIGQLNNVAIGGTPSPGSVPVATDSTHATWGNNTPTGSGFYFVLNGVRNDTAHIIQPQDLPNPIQSDTTGNSGTTAAFNHTPTPCASVAGVPAAAAGVDTQGNAVGCFVPAGSGQPGSVTTLTVNDIPDIAHSTVATASTTPVVSYALIGAPAHSFFGNNTDNEGGAPGYSNLTLEDLPEEIAGGQAHNTVWAAPDATNGFPTFRALLQSDVPFAAPLTNPSFSGNVFAGGASPHNFSTPDGGYCFGAVSVSATPVICLWSDNATNVHFGDSVKADASTIVLTAHQFNGTLNGSATGVGGNQVPNVIYAGPPNGANAPASFRAMASADLPTNPTLHGNVDIPTGSVTVDIGNITSSEGFITPGGVVTAGLFTAPFSVTYTPTNTIASAIGNVNVVAVNGAGVTAGCVCTLSIGPSASESGQIITIVKTDSNGTAQINVKDAGSGTIDGQAGYLLYQQYQAVTLHSDGTNWQVVSQFNLNISGDQPANEILAAPNGAFGHPAFRTLVNADTPQSAGLALNNNFSGVNTVPTPVSTTNTTQIANTQFVHGLVNNITAGMVSIPAGFNAGSLTISGLSATSVCTASPQESGTNTTQPLNVFVATNTLTVATPANVTVAQPVFYICAFKPQ